MTGGRIKVAPIETAGGVSESSDGPLAEIASAAERGADLILLPQLSFYPYFPSHRDREALELGERLPPRRMTAALAQAGESHLCGSVYECSGEGLFYVRGELGTATAGCLLADRQRRVEAAQGRYEQMFFRPGAGPRGVAELPWGRTGLLLGADAREVEAWSDLVKSGAVLILVSVSEDGARWQGTKAIASGMAAVYGVAVALVNRGPTESQPDFAGGDLVIDASGGELSADENGIFDVSISAKGISDE